MPRWLVNIVLSLFLLLAFAGVPLLYWFPTDEPRPDSKLLYWFLAMTALIVFILVLGYRIKSRPLGALIDERNKMSLSRLQLITWTVLLLAGYSTAALWNLFAIDSADPLAVGWQEELWWLLGISTTSFVGSPLILNIKKEQVPNPTEQTTNLQILRQQQVQRLGEQQLERLVQQQGAAAPLVSAVGQVPVNEDPHQASLTDMFRGDEIGNGPFLDMSKVQMFFFTVVILLAYGMSLGNLFLTATGEVSEFPALSASILVLLGISHAGYLGYKGVSHSDSATRPRVPNVVGRQLDVAVEEVTALGFVPDPSEVKPSQEPENQVLNSQPPAGTLLDLGERVTLFFSGGP